MDTKEQKNSNMIPQEKAIITIRRSVNLVMPLTIMGLLLAYDNLILDLPVMLTPWDRIIFTLKWHGISISVLYAHMENVIHERSRKAWNPLDPNNQGNAVILGRIFSNTLEQFVLFVSSTVILSIYLTTKQMNLIPILVFIWCIGRMLFDFGYQKSPLYRTPGFILSGVPTLVSLSLISYLQFYEGPWIMSIASAYFGLRRFILFLFYNDASPITLFIGSIQ